MGANVTATSGRIVFLAVCVFVGGCASTDDVQQGQGTVESSSSDIADTVDSIPTVPSPYVVRQASGYLRELLDSTYGPEEVMIAFTHGPSDALETVDFVVAGYLFEISPGITIDDTTTGGTLSRAELTALSIAADQLERRFKAEGATEDDWQELQKIRDNISQNKPSRSDVDHYWVYRIRITEVFKGDYKEDDIIDIQVYAGHNLGTELSAQMLEGTPRVVVAGTLESLDNPKYEYRNSDGTIVEQANWDLPDIFWFDEGVWETLDDDSALLSGESLEDDTVNNVTGSPLEEGPQQSPTGPVLTAESHYLDGIHEMDEAWGDLASLDDLADALRAAASPTTTTTAAPATTVASTTTESLQP